MEITLESLGLTKKALEEKVIEIAVEKLLSGVTYDEDGNVDYIDSKLQEKMKKLIKERIDETVNIFAEKNVLPKVSEYIETINLQETNTWGEKKGEPLTFIEYLLKRAEAYMCEEVDTDGNSAKDCKRRGRSFYGSKHTRLAYMVDKHLYISIETAMKQALKDVDSIIAEGLCETVKIKLKEIQEKISIGMNVKK